MGSDEPVTWHTSKMAKHRGEAETVLCLDCGEVNYYPAPNDVCMTEGCVNSPENQPVDPDPRCRATFSIRCLRHRDDGHLTNGRDTHYASVRGKTVEWR